jgi:hypothetical protein
VAAFVLEVARRFHATASRPPRLHRSEWFEARTHLEQMIEWACELLRREGKPTPLERLWFVASLEFIAHEVGDNHFVQAAGAA